MRKTWLTPMDQMRLDPTGKARLFLKSIDRDGKPVPSPFICGKMTPDEWLCRYREVRNKNLPKRHLIYKEFDEHFDNKYAPQGKTFPLSVVLANYELSYKLAERKLQLHPMLYQARDYLIRLIKQRVETVGYPADPMFTPVVGTAAGLPTMTAKGSYEAETAFPQSKWRHVFPDLPGERYMKRKPRTINQDANSNVRYMEYELSTTRKWLKQQFPDLFSAWLRPDLRTTPMITRMLEVGCFSIETDYTECDNHFSLDLVAELVLPIYEVLIPGEMNYLRFAAYIEELFHQEIYMGSYLISGKHNLLSGQCITNDFETIFDVICAIAALFANGVSLEQAVILALGDDMAILIRQILGRKLAESIKASFIELAQSAGMEFNLEKCSLHDDRVTFCKKVYYKAGPRDMNGNIAGAYPCVLSLNSIVNPEHLSKTLGDLLAATVQRMDNTNGSPMFHSFVQFVGANLLPYKDSYKLQSDAVQLSTTDWWERVYNERWNFSSSPAAEILAKNNLLKKWLK